MAASQRYKIGTLSDLTGLSPSLLRAWERRYDILAPERGSGGHREYTDKDLSILRYVKSLIDEGRSIGEIAAVGRQALLEAAKTRERKTKRRPPPPNIDAIVDRIVEGAVAVNQTIIGNALDDIFARVSPNAAIQHALVPAAQRIGDLWMENRCSVAGEHLASSLFTERLLSLFKAAQPPSRNGTVDAICACFPEEQHTLGNLVVAYLLGQRGLNVTLLGGRLPLEDLETSIAALSPSAVFLSVTHSHLFEEHAPRVRELAEEHDEIRFFVGGRGVPGETANGSPVRLVPSENGSVDELLEEILTRPNLRSD